MLVMASIYPTPPSSPSAAPLPSAGKGDVEHLLPDEKTSSTSSFQDYPSPLGSCVSASNSTHQSKQTSCLAETVDPATLKSLLGISNWPCGYPTKQKTPCKIKVLKSNRAEVDLKIKSIAKLVQSSPELGDELQGLAKLIQCRFHSNSHVVEVRAKTWLGVFPPGVQNIDPTIYLEREMRAALGPPSTQCTGEITTQTNCSTNGIEQERCSLKVGGQKVDNSIRTIDKIIFLVAHFGDNAEVEYLLKVLERSRQCEDHNDGPLEHTHAWKPTVLDIQSKYQTLCAASSQNGSTGCHNPQTTPDAENGRKAPCVEETQPHPRIQGSLVSTGSQAFRPWLSIEPAKYWPAAYDASSFDKVEKKSKLSGSQASAARISDKARSNLNEKAGDLKDGYMYLYQVDGNEKYVKIGYTTRDVLLRHKEWEFDCNRVPKMLYPGQSRSERVPNVRRVEALCHKELDHCRVKFYCRVCLKEHNEWFEIAAADGIKVIQKWSKWMADDPYEKKLLRSETKWVLKVDQLKKVLDLVSS